MPSRHETRLPPNDTRFAQRERPLAQGADLCERQHRHYFVKRANLLNRPLRTRTVGGGGGGRELETPAYPIRRQ